MRRYFEPYKGLASMVTLNDVDAREERGTPMFVLEQPTEVSSAGPRPSFPAESVGDIATDECYRVFALPASHTVSDDVIISDMHGTPYLLTHDSPTPAPIAREMLDLLGMAFEPSQDISWHSVTELHRLIYGDVEVATPLV